MPKRKQKDKKRHLKMKLRRLEDRLDRYSSSSDSTSEEEYNDYERYYPGPRDPSYAPTSDGEVPILPLSDSDNSITDTIPKSVVVATAGRHAPEPSTAELHIDPGSEGQMANPDQNPTTAVPLTRDPGPSANTEPMALPVEILEALGDPKGKEEVYGPKIPEEISKRWGRILVDGLSKELKQSMAEKHLVPENFRLAKAPILNPEIMPVLSESARHRDKLLEKSQNQLGLGISELTNLASTVIQGDLNKIEILKKISEISQIFLDLHYEDTKRRRKLVTSSLDKKFLNMITDVKRDTYLFGADLGEKIKASKTAERSGLQIKRSDAVASTSRKYSAQGNWRGPPRTHTQRAYKQGGPKARYPPQQNRRFPPAPDRQPRAPAKTTTAKTRKA